MAAKKRKAAAPKRRRRVGSAVRSAARTVRRTARRGYSRAKSSGIVDSVMDIAIGVGAAAVAGFALSKIPNVTPTVKSAIAIGAGAFLAGNKKPMLKNAGVGLGIAGGLALLRTVAPAVPQLAGDDDADFNFGAYEMPQLTALGDPVSLGDPVIPALNGSWKHNG